MSPASALERAEQNFHAMAQLGVSEAGFVQIRGGLVAGQLQRGLEGRPFMLVHLAPGTNESPVHQGEIATRMLSGEK